MSPNANNVPVGSVTTWLSGGTPNRANPNYWDGTVPWISASTLKRTKIYDSDQRITEAGVRVGSKLAPQGATLVLVRGMALHREVRAGLAMRSLSFNQDVKALIPRTGLLPEYLTYSLHAQRESILKLVSSAGSGTGVLDTNLLKRLPIWLPDLREQAGIVSAIEASESAAELLELLLAKKQAVKQGIMQQLLTGKTRLPGFTRTWDEVSLGDLAQFSKGMGLPKSSLVPAGQYPCIHYGELFTLYGPEIQSVLSRTNDSSLRVRSAAHDVLMPTSDVTPRGLAKASSVEADGVILGGDILVIRPDGSRLLGPFLANAIRHHANQVLQLVRGSTVFHLYASDMKTFRLRVPAIDEQHSICRALRDAESEVDLLRKRLDKAEEVKAGMMQELLTGRTRLTIRESAV